MKNLIVLAAGVSAVAVASPALAQPEYIPGQYICTFDASVSKGEVVSASKRAADTVRGTVMRDYKNTIRGFAVRMPNENSMGNPKAAMKRGGSPVADCEQDQIATVDLYPTPKAPSNKAKPGSGGGSPSQSTPYGISRVKGLANYTGSNVAWIIDTGIDLDHEDLNVDVGRSVNFVERESSPEDLNGHGTHVAGTVAAVNNSIGVIGVAPGAKVIAVRVLNRRGSGSYSGIIAGVDHVAANGAPGDVANMSLGGGYSQALNDAVIAAAANGIHFALAAGNESTDANTKSPASANGANVYTVSSMTSSDSWSSFSNYGNPPVDYAEPGSSILSTYKGNGYSTLSGTSMASPHLAGILLATGGNPQTSGTVKNDPDGNPDPIGVVSK
ncbi:S8 family serine peptidase [Sphingomicrobium nitratireducens]|uniref:S8 family serine peptidase n=1 Tax=Sphingomicrobium nitratireducens TaxID=2964666 RepID=UPI00223EFB2B|nr:S8 family serine peptidase [Sphingomicrobium nitratireducens]